MLFQQSNSTPCIKEQLEEEGHRWWWRMRHQCEEHEALIVTTEVEWSRLSWSYSVAQGKQLLPLTQTHTHTHAHTQETQTWSTLLGKALRLNRPLWLTLAKINWAAVRTRPGNHEIWGQLRGGISSCMQSRGDVHGLPVVGKGTQSDKCWGKGWEAESTLRAAHQLWSREHSVPAPPAVFPITNPGQGG